MKTNFKRKVLSMLLVVVMLVSVIPTTARAEEGLPVIEELIINPPWSYLTLENESSISDERIEQLFSYATSYFNIKSWHNNGTVANWQCITTPAGFYRRNEDASAQNHGKYEQISGKHTIQTGKKYYVRYAVSMSSTCGYQINSTTEVTVNSSGDPSDYDTIWVEEDGTTSSGTTMYLYVRVKTKAEPVQPQVSEPPKAVDNLVYNGNEQTLIESGYAKNGELHYAVNKDGTTLEDVPWSPDLPQEKNAGTYYVWYKAVDSGGNEDNPNEPIEVTIAKAKPEYELPVGLTATYGDTLEKVELPTGWEWMDKTENVGDIGEKKFKANFTPCDIENYETIENVEVTVTVKSDEPETPTYPIDGFISDLGDNAITVENNTVKFDMSDEDYVYIATVLPVSAIEQYMEMTAEEYINREMGLTQNVPIVDTVKEIDMVGNVEGTIKMADTRAIQISYDPIGDDTNEWTLYDDEAAVAVIYKFHKDNVVYQEYGDGEVNPYVFKGVEGNPRKTYIYALYGVRAELVVSEGTTTPENPVAPTITEHPQDVTKTVGETATFSVVASGEGTLFYQWEVKKNGSNDFETISGATSETYTTPTLTMEDDGNEYRCVVKDESNQTATSNSATSNSATSNSAKLIVKNETGDDNTSENPVAPTINGHPQEVTATVGETATFTVTATGASITYQWRVDKNDGNGFVNIDGATGASYTTPAVDTSYNGYQYQCIVTNDGGSVTSNVAKLTVTGGSSSGGGYYPSYPSIGGGSSSGTQITVPVKNPETTVNVTAKVEENKATVDAIKDEELAKVIDTKEETTIEIDLTGLDKTIDTAVIPTETMEKIAKAVSDTTNKVDGLTIKLSTATVTMDAKALEAVVAQADGDNIQLNVDDVHTGRLNDVQMKAVEKLDVHKGIEAYFTCNGKRIGDFKGGAVTLELPFEVPTGYKPAGFSVWYVDDNGNSTKYKSSYLNGMLSFIVDHFSDFIVVYDEADAEEKETETKPETEQPKQPIELNNTFRYLRLKGKETTKDTIKLVWNKVADADGYVLYGNKCNANGKKYTIKKIAVIKDDTVTKQVMKDLEEGTYYKYYIKAYKLVNGKKVFLAKSKTIHVTTAGGKYGNAKAVDVNATEVSLNLGETFDIQAKQVKENKKIAKHTTIKFESSKSAVAKVNKNGTITAKKKGTATIYVYAQNGVYKKVKVTVK